MLHKLGSLIDGNDSIRVVLVLSNPDGILAVSVGLLLGISGLVRFDVLDGLANIILSLLKGLSVVVSHLSVGGNLSTVIGDSGAQIVDDSGASSCLSSS